ncbi:Gfo/Idh/MocA family protein [Candidatus Latescibacterota bacterium]
MDRDVYTNNNGPHAGEAGESKYFNRRDVLKGLATLPVLGVFFQKLIKKRTLDKDRKEQILSELGMEADAPEILPLKTFNSSGRELRLGVIGYGSRGEYLLRAAGFAHPSWLESMKQGALEDKTDERYEDFMTQDDLNVVFNGVCDVFDIRAEKGLETIREGSNREKVNKTAKRYRRYTQMLESDDIDAVIVATPEHWHAQMTIDAARAGKHLYLEKPLTRTIPEVYEVADAVRNSNIKFQLGHQGRQTDAYLMARKVVEKGILGRISLIEVTTNRNDPNGAWLYNIHHEASPMNIDWRQFLGKSPRRPFSLEKFFRWRLWFDYGTGLSGDLFTHEYDALNMILDLGIPKSAVASGGIYYYKDGREVPDVYQAVYEYPDRDLTLLYSATLSSNTKRGKLLMGSDAVMDLGQLHASAMSVTADANSKRYLEKIEKGIINTDLPMFAYTPGSKGIDAVTTATEKYFAGRGLLYTYRNGRRYDTTHLHIAEWLDAVRCY